jgi:multiple sugar transport system permease protein
MYKADIVRKKSSKWQRTNNIQGTLFACVPVLRFVVFGFVPLVLGLLMAFLPMKNTFNIMDGLNAGFTLDNFKAVFGDKTFWNSIINTFYLALAWPISMLIALLVSILLTKNIKGKPFFRTVYFIPFVCSLVAVTLMWNVILDYNYGVANNIIEWFSGTRINWRGDAKWYRFGLICMTVWSTTGYKIIILTAALTSVNKSLYEAASLDGANAPQKVWHVTLPAISPTVFYLFVTGLIDVLQEFTRSQVWDKAGGPNGTGITMVFYLYREGFLYVNMGTASAVAWILSIFILIITLLNFALSKKWVKYD